MLLAMLLAATLHAGPAAAYRPPRAPDGKPDLQGDWTNLSMTPLERMPMFKTLVAPQAEADRFAAIFNDGEKSKAYFAELRAKTGRPPPPDVGDFESEWFDRITLARIDGQLRTSWITDPADGQLPYTPAAQAVNKAAGKRINRVFDNPEDRDIHERCVLGTAGGPPLGNTFYNAAFKIVQTKDEVAIAMEMDHDVRHIRLNAAHASPALRPWMGDSTGAWQGDVLRVETKGFRPEYAKGPGLDFLLSPGAVVTEWFARTAPDEIRYRFQVDDPATYTRPWRGEMVLHPGKPIIEYACHEGNYALSGILAGAREWERRGKTPEPLDGGDPPPKAQAATTAVAKAP